jgi:DNA-binding MarR family transcriptional regulator
MHPALATTIDLSYVRSRILVHVDEALGAHHGLALSDLALLLALRDAPERGLRRTDLATRLGVTTSDVVRQLGPLERRGIVGREATPRDPRMALVTLTDAGAALADDARPTAEETAERALASLWPGGEHETLGALLQQARAAGV